MNKTDLIKGVAKDTGIDKKEVASVVDSLFDVIETAIKNNEKVGIQNFGIFELRHRGSRKGRNIHTGEEIEILPRFTPYWKPATAFKELVNPEDDQ